jgi:hypothetical protein
MKFARPTYTDHDTAAGGGRRSGHRRWGILRTSAVSAVAATVVGLVPAAAAQGAVAHPFLSSFDTAAGGSQLLEPGATAVDHASGRLFVADPGAGTVDVYSATGEFITALEEATDPVGVGVDASSGVVYVADGFENLVLVYAPNGETGYSLVGEWTGAALPEHQFGEVTGVAVDNSGGPSAGDVYVVDGGEAVVDAFKPGVTAGPEGSFVRVLSKGKMEEPNGIAIDEETGRVYVADAVKAAVYEYSAAGIFEGKFNGSGSPLGPFGSEESEENVSGVAVDRTSGDLLVAEAERGVVEEFTSGGEWVGWIPSLPGAALGEPTGIAVGPAGDVYVSDLLLSRVDHYGPGTQVPDALTEKPGKPTRTTADLNGTVNNGGKPGQYFFQWGTSTELGSSTTPTPFGGAEQAVTAALSGLHAGTSYFYRVVATNENGTSYGATVEFETPPAVEKLNTGPIANLQTEGVTLTGSLAPNGFDTHYYFEWGTTAAYGHATPVPPGGDAGSAKGTLGVETALTGLTPNTTYHYRLVGENEFGATRGADARFTTSGPPRITTKAASGVGHDLAQLNAEVNPDQLQTTYHFEYGETSAYGTEAPSGGAAIGSGSSNVAVSAALTGLKLGVTYHFRVVASNSAGASAGPDQTFTTVPPALVTAFASGVKSTEATLNAQVNPLGHDTTYYFQYGTAPCGEEASECTSSPAPPGQDVGAGEAPVLETLAVAGLQPATTYHYRVVATNSLGVTEGSEHTITTQSPVTPLELPDGRAWEMVTPPNKHGAPIEALTREGGVILAAEDGERLTYVALGAIDEEPQGNRSPEMQQVLGTRTPRGWESQDIVTPQTRAQGISAGNPPEYQYFTPDLGEALVEPVGVGAEPPLAEGVTQKTMYVRDNRAGTYVPIVTQSDVAPGTAFQDQVEFVGATPDLTHVVIRSKVALEGEGSGPGLYEWHAGALKFISALPSGAPGPAAELGFFHVRSQAISEDGTRVIWTTFEENSHRGHLYLTDTSSGKSVQLDAAQGAPEPEGKGSAQFQGASADGSRVFFTDMQRLTADSTAEPSQVTQRPDLYSCEVADAAGKPSCHLEDLTVDHNTGEHATVQGFIFGQASNGTAVYLLAQGVLATNENGEGQRAESGQNNLYSLHLTEAGWETRFIATLSSQDSPEWEGGKQANTSFLTARSSPNGRYLAFMSAASLTGYDNIDAASAAGGARDEEVYLYDSAEEKLTCVSCNASGERPSGVLDREAAGEGSGLLVDRRLVWGAPGHEHWLAGSIPGWTAQSLVSALYQSRYLTDKGRLFFDSPDELVPAAGNHKENVYEYEPSGVGSCESATGGCVALLSSGESPRESSFLEATPDGSSAFFLTAAKLLPQDTDTAFDIYDARVCTSASPCLSLPAGTEEGCESSDTCRPALPPSQPPGVGGGTASFTGPGSPHPAPSQFGVQSAKTTKTTKPASKPLTRAQLLARALVLCRRHHPHSLSHRRSCERAAHKRYGAHKASAKAKHGGHR